MSNQLTKLPSDSPRAYARSQLGPKTIRWMRRQGWLDHRRAVRLHENASAAYRRAALSEAEKPEKDITA